MSRGSSFNMSRVSNIIKFSADDLKLTVDYLKQQQEEAINTLREAIDNNNLVDVNKVIENENSLHRAFQGAVTNGHIDLANFCLDKGADIKHKFCGHGNVACEKGYTAIVELLLNRGFDIDNLRVGIFRAIRNGHTEIVKLLLDRGLHIGCVRRTNSLNDAICNGYTEIVKLLLDRGLTIMDIEQHSFIIAREKGYTEIVQLILTLDINFEKK